MYLRGRGGAGQQGGRGRVREPGYAAPRQECVPKNQRKGSCLGHAHPLLHPAPPASPSPPPPPPPLAASLLYLAESLVGMMMSANCAPLGIASFSIVSVHSRHVRLATSNL